MTTRLILIRHASTKPLEAGKVEERDYNELLSKKGHWQVEALANRLADVDAVIWSSPQPRAMITARVLGKTGAVLIEPVLEDWREGETRRQMYRRVTRFTDALEGMNIVVSHGTPIAMILTHQVYGSCHYQASWGITPASISIIQNGVIVAMNDVSHLGILPECVEYDPHTWTYKGGEGK